MYSEIVREPLFYFDPKGQFYPEATTFIMTGKHLDYLYPLFHSKCVTFFFKTFYAGGGLGESGYRYKKAFFEKVPVPLFTGTILQQQIVQAQPTDCIEDKVLDLYGLTPKEKAYILSAKNG